MATRPLSDQRLLIKLPDPAAHGKGSGFTRWSDSTFAKVTGREP